MLSLRKPSWWALLLTLAGVVFFVELGMWQLRRAHFKQQLLTRFADAASQRAQPFGDVANGVPPDSYPHVRVRGKLLGERLYVLDNRTRHDRPGIVVFAPMRVCADVVPCRAFRQRVLLVALGFLPRDKGWRSLPSLPPVRDRLVTVDGLYAPPPANGLELDGNALARQQDWPKVTTYLDLAQVADDLGQPVEPRVLLLDPDPASAYIRSWTPATMPPARHRAYAVQWFTFALAAVVIFLILHRKRPRQEHDDDN